jgi:RNase P subunit RPR2
MMAIVIGTDEKALKQITCRECASIIQYTASEVRLLWSGTDYSGGSDGAKGFTCPKCGKDIHTERW